MSDKSKRRYKDYAWVVLNATIKCPVRGTSNDAFPATDFAFFIEDGMFCIESKKNGAITDVHPAQIKEARRVVEEAPAP